MRRPVLYGNFASFLADLSDAALWLLYEAYGARMDAMSRLYVVCEIEARSRFAGVK